MKLYIEENYSHLCELVKEMFYSNSTCHVHEDALQFGWFNILFGLPANTIVRLELQASRLSQEEKEILANPCYDGGE